MRDESQAPRNSREVAVRNQFFTPRYVVQFLVDNTLGRMWTEMRGTTTALREHCEYFVELEDERPERTFKDPRNIRVLDPACGSGHFLLYAFDLLARMYVEAWELGFATEGCDSLRETYESLAGFKRAIPGLILDRNLHGIEIDPRGTNCSPRPLVPRERFWHDSAVPAAERPRIRRTGIVVAEPMPGDKELVDEFAARLRPPLLGLLFRQIVQSMSLAGDMGFLLRAESRNSPATSHGRERSSSRSASDHRRFQDSARSSNRASWTSRASMTTSSSPRPRTAFSTRSLDMPPRPRVPRAPAGAYSADDSTHGVALLELLRQRFDVVLMNPPFGAGSVNAKQVFDRNYPRTKNDVYAAFVERGIELLLKGLEEIDFDDMAGSGMTKKELLHLRRSTTSWTARSAASRTWPGCRVRCGWWTPRRSTSPSVRRASWASR